jgi:hypothetical protein
MEVLDTIALRNAFTSSSFSEVAIDEVERIAFNMKPNGLANVIDLPRREFFKIFSESESVRRVCNPPGGECSPGELVFPRQQHGRF